MFARTRTLAIMVALAVASQTIYLAFVIVFPLVLHGNAGRPFDMEILSRGRPWMFSLWTAGVFLLYGIFALALAVVDGSRRTRSLILVSGIVFAGTLVWLYPVTATDLFQYVLRARLQVLYGANPMLVAPSQYPHDPLIPFAGEWKGILSPYGPAWELLAGLVARLGAVEAVSGGLAFKCVAFASYAVCTGLLAWWGGSRGDGTPSNIGLLLWAWNPLVLLQGLGNGHNDMAMLALLVAALVVWGRAKDGGGIGRWTVVAVLLALATMLKLAASLMVFLVVVAVVRDQTSWQRRLLALLTLTVVGLGTVALVFIPFWPPWRSIAGVLDEMANRYTYTVAAMLRLWLRQTMAEDAARFAPRLAGQCMALCFFCWAVVHLWRRRLDLATAGFLATLAYLLGGTSFRIWYPLWLVPLAAMQPLRAVRWRTLLFCFTSELSLVFFYFVWRWYWPGASWLQMHMLVVPWQYGLPLVLPAVWNGDERRG